MRFVVGPAFTSKQAAEAYADDLRDSVFIDRVNTGIFDPDTNDSVL